MKKNRNITLFLLAWAAQMATVFAHPGHDLLEHGSAHVATSPYHLAGLCAVCLLLFGAARLVKAPTAKRLLGGAGFALLAFTIVWGLPSR